MHLTRRALLRAGVAALAVASSPLRWVKPSAALPAIGSGGGPMWLTRATYVPLVNSAFSVPVAGGSAVLELLAVRDIGVGLPSREECFSLLFDGGQARFGQGSYLVSHPQLGSSELFVVPVGPPVEGTQAYEVVVNRQ